MKKLILILCLFGVTASYAQQAATKPKPIMILLPDSSNLVQLQSVLSFSYQWLPKSSAPANTVEEVKSAIQQLFPLLVPIKKDSTIKVKPIVVKKDSISKGKPIKGRQ